MLVEQETIDSLSVSFLSLFLVSLWQKIIDVGKPVWIYYIIEEVYIEGSPAL